MSNIGLVIQREYYQRVHKKSFIITTILMPLLMVLLMAAPALLMFFSKSDTKVINVIDKSGVIFSSLKSNEDVEFKTTDLTLEEARKSLTEDFAVLYIGEDILTDNSSIALYTNSAGSVMIEEGISGSVADVIENERLKAYDIENLAQIMEDVKADVSLKTVRNDKSQESGKDDTSTSSVVAMALGYILGMVLYMFILIYGSMVMTSVIEEKSSRVLEVLVSSVRPFDLMMGKILSIALVAITQIVIWGVLISLFAVFLLPILMPAEIMESVTAVQSGAALSPAMSGDMEMIQAMATLTDFGYIAQNLGLAVVFLIGGYLLYSAMFAAIGSSVDTAEDTQNLQLPVTMPIILSFVVLTLITKDPNGLIVRIFSLFPMTSPIVMVGRIPHGIASWEIYLSLVLLFASFFGMVWVAAKIYRVGIFMHGKKPTFKELWKWMRYKY